jgi:hypothetical protein
MAFWRAVFRRVFELADWATKDETEKKTILSGPMTAPPSGHVDLGEEEA